MIRDVAKLVFVLASVILIGKQFGAEVPDVPFLVVIWWAALLSVLALEKK